MPLREYTAAPGVADNEQDRVSVAGVAWALMPRHPSIVVLPQFLVVRASGFDDGEASSEFRDYF